MRSSWSPRRWSCLPISARAPKGALRIEGEHPAVVAAETSGAREPSAPPEAPAAPVRALFQGVSIKRTGQKPKRVIAVSGGKGGAGKTVLAVNLGIYLSTLGRTTLVVDADRSGAHLHTLIGVPPLLPSQASYRPELPALDALPDTYFDEYRIAIEGDGRTPLTVGLRLIDSEVDVQDMETTGATGRGGRDRRPRPLVHPLQLDSRQPRRRGVRGGRGRAAPPPEPDLSRTACGPTRRGRASRSATGPSPGWSRTGSRTTAAPASSWPLQATPRSTSAGTPFRQAHPGAGDPDARRSPAPGTTPPAPSRRGR